MELVCESWACSCLRKLLEQLEASLAAAVVPTSAWPQFRLSSSRRQNVTRGRSH